MKRFTFLIMSFLCITLGNAQIGYQVSLLNTATGEPRANEKVTAKIELSNSDGEVVYSETQTGVTNDFGVLSLTIGNAQSLSAIDWSKYPMFISVTVDNVLIGKTQVMSVPYANAVVPLSMDLVVGTWVGTYTCRRIDSEYVEFEKYSFSFSKNGIVDFIKTTHNNNKYGTKLQGFFTIQGDEIHCFCKKNEQTDYVYNNYNIYYVLQYINGQLHIISQSDGPSLSKQ